MEVKVFERPGKEWDEFASRYTDLIFYQSVWSEVLRKGLGGQPLYFYLMDRGEMVAGLPGVLLNFRVLRVYYASIPYGSFLGNPSYFMSMNELLERMFRRIGIDQSRIVQSPFTDPYTPAGYRSIVSKCSLLDLGRFNGERIESGYRSEIQRAVRKAERSGLTIRQAATKGEVEIFYKLYLSSMERNRAAAKYPLRWFYALFEEMVSRGKADILFAVTREGEYAAGVLVVHSPTVDHYLHNGSSKAYLENRPNDLIVDSMIRKAVMEGKSILDFMGSDPRDLSLLRFKEKWGSRSVDIHTYVKDYHLMRCKIWEAGRRMMESGLGSWLVRKIRK